MTTRALREYHRLAVGALDTIASGKRRTREQWHAKATLLFLETQGDEIARAAIHGSDG